MSAATTAAAAAMSAVLPKLAALLQEEDSKLQRGRQQDVAFLGDELQQLQGSLEAAAESQGGDPHLEECSRKLRDLFFDVEDSVHGFLRRAGREQPGPKTKPPPRGFGRFADKAMDLTAGAMRRRRFAEQLRGLRSRLEEVRQQWWCACRLSTTPRPCWRTRIGAPRPAPGSAAEASRLAGLSRHRDELVARLLLVGEGREVDDGSAKWLRVVSVLGDGGPGALRLLGLAYSARLRSYAATAGTTAAAKGTTSSDASENACMLSASRNSMYLVVLDGMWNPEAWIIIGASLPQNDLGSRVITTTCSTIVAKSCSSNCNSRIYNIKTLSLGDCRNLVHGRIFGSVESCPPDLADVADRILIGCAGFPLAIAAISSLLACKPRARSVREDVCNCITASPRTAEGMRRILSLGYHDVSHHLKVCLWHLSIFPADYPIDHNRVIRSWMVQGLIIRSESVKENFVTVLENGKPASVSSSKIRRLSIISFGEGHDIDIPASSVTMSRIRSLYIFGNAGKKLTFKNLTFLRVLDLQGCKDLKNHNVKEIAGIRDLRYSSIRDTPISEIPDQIAQLQNLTTLDLRGTEVQELPASVLQLQRQRLEHLGLVYLPNLGKMAALSCLSQYEIL
uniref:Rx N-terminal domain-containing protein n=1 Tax=Setaria italica TaxID=4555 RepID=K4A0G1_SETIT